MIYVIIILVIVLSITVFTLIKSLRRYDIIEDELSLADEFVNSSYTSMSNAYIRMKELDRLGAFEADDETGYIFEEIKAELEKLNNEYNLDGEET
tara:strand:+ start:190 stop:474 length:285 start_codon:yes stop_codon:yes gene_type:complete